MDTCWEESSARMDAKLDQTTGHPPDLMHRNIMQQSSGSDLSSRPPPQQQPQKVQQMMMMYPHHHQPFMESAVPVYHHHHHHHLPPYQNQQQNGGKAGSAEEARTVWIGDLHHWMDETYLHTCFNHNNQVSSIKVVRNKLTGQTEGYGFVEFHSHEAAEKVLQSYNGATMPNTDQPFRLNWASFAVDRRAGADAAAGSDVCIFVGDLAADVTDTLLLETFAGKYPSVRVAKVVVDSNTGRSKGYGFVRFGDENERSKAIIEMNGVYCSSRPMRLGVATPRKMPVYQTQYSYQAVALSGGHGANGAMSQGSQSDADSNNTTIFVGGIGSDVTDEDLRQPFSQFGELVSVKIPAGKGCGFVQFANRKNAKEALESLNGTVIGKQTVRLSWGQTPANKDNTSLQPVSEQSCVTTEDDEIETAYNKAREVVLKRFAAKRADRLSRGKRSAEDEDDKEQQLDSKSSTFSCVMADALEGDGLQNTCSSLELMLPRLVREEVQHELSKLGLVPLAERPSAKRIEGPYRRNLQLHFRNNLSRTLFTGAKVEGEQGAAVHVVLLDANSGHVVTSGPESSIKLDVVALDGDFQYEDDEDWTHTEFQTRVVHERTGRRPLLTGDLQVALKEGVGTLGDLVFTDNTSWIRSRKFRLGLKVASGFFEGIRIREAKTEAFVVKDHRGELYKKHFPPLLNDNVWRLEKIAKNGVFHKRLNNHEIFTVEDFLCHMAKDSAKLRNILGGVSDRVWYTIQEHAKTCVLGEKFFAEQYFASGSVSDLQKLFVDSLVKKENENQIDVVEFDGKSHLNLKQSKGPSGCNNDYQGLVNMEEVQGAHTVDSAGRKDRPSKVWTVKGVQDCHIPHSVRTASRFYNLRDRPGCHQTSKAVRLLIEVVKSTIDQFAELPAWQPSATSVTKSRSAAANQPFRSKEDEPQKSQQQQEPEQIGCGSWRDFNSLVDFFTFLHQLDPSAVHHPGSSVLRPSLDSDAIADTIKSFFSIGSSSSGGSQNLFQSHPVPSLLQYIKEVQDMLLHVSSITNIDLGADSLTRILGMSKLKVYNLFCKVPKSLPSIFQAENFVELHLPHYNHRLIWAGKLAFVNLRLINLKHSLKLITLPDLSMAQKIVHLNLRGCVKLIQVSYIRNLVKLEELNLSNCENIKILPSLIGLQNLREFYLSGCSNLRELPPSIIALNSLVVLDLKNCAQLYALPRFTSGLQSLQKLNISGCTNILRSLDMKGNRESYRLYGRFLGSTISGAYRDLSTPGRASQFVEAAAAPEQKKSTTKKAKKNSAPQVVQVEITEEKELTIKNFNSIASMEKEERKRKSVESAVTTCKEVRVKRTCNDPDDSLSFICQPFHEPEAVVKFSDGQGRESKLMDSSVSAPRSSAVLVYGPNLTGSAPEAVEEAILDCGSKLIGDTEPAPANQSPNLNKNTLLGLAIEDPTSREGEDVGLGNSSDHPREECIERVPLDVGKTTALCDPHKLAEKSSDGGMESNTGVFNHQPNGTEPLLSYEENDEIDRLKNEIQKLQEQLAASEKRRDGFRECYDSLELELWPLRAELEVEHVNLTEQKQKQEESELEASNAWEDLKKLVAQTIF